MRPIAVLGAGSYGTAVAVHWARSGHPVRLWVRRPEVAAELARTRRNEYYLPGVEFPSGLETTSRIGDLVATDLVAVAVPSHGYRAALAAFLEARGDRAALTVVSTAKGIEPETLKRMSVVSEEEGERHGTPIRFAVLSGPTFAEELARNVPSAAVVASTDAALSRDLREALAGPTLRLYSSDDVLGVEVAGTAKNVIAIGAGIIVGLGLGHNTLAALITRGLHEMTRLVVACGGQHETLRGLAGLGDLVLTCTGGPSRNRRTGIELAQGKSLAEITAATTMVAEGVKNSLAIAALAREQGVEMPIIDQMVAVLYENRSPKRAVQELMTRDLKHESEL